MTTLRVIVDQMLAPVPGGIGRYTEELARALIEAAPTDCFVEGVVSASTEAEYASLRERLPGLAGLHKSHLGRRELAASWQYGLTRLPGGGMIHSPNLLAPLGRHDRLNNAGEQIAVTIHDAAAWTYPESLPALKVNWQKTMARRAQKYADAIVVPTHAVAEQLSEFLDFGDRIRVIGGAVSSKLSVPVDANARAERLGLPERYILAVGDLAVRRGIDQLIRALALPTAPHLPLLVVGPKTTRGVHTEVFAMEAGIPEGRVHAMGYLSDADLSVALDRATVFVFPSLDEGFGHSMLEAFHFGTPVIHSDAPALVEVAADSGLIVPREGENSYPERLAAAITRVVGDTELSSYLAVQGQDRARAYSWRGAAEKVWQLHADL